MTTFDGSTRHRATDQEWTPPGVAEPEPVSPVDSLDLLRDQLAAKRQETEEPEFTVVEAPGGAIRLRCSQDIESKQVTGWNRKALPPARRKAANISPLEVDQMVMNGYVLIDTCESVEVLNPSTKQWVAITDTEGNALTFKDKVLLQTLGVVDPLAAIKKLFPRDPDLIRAGQDVLRGGGWGDPDAGDEDPS